MTFGASFAGRKRELSDTKPIDRVVLTVRGDVRIVLRRLAKQATWVVLDAQGRRLTAVDRGHGRYRLSLMCGPVRERTGMVRGETMGGTRKMKATVGSLFPGVEFRGKLGRAPVHRTHWTFELHATARHQLVEVEIEEVADCDVDSHLSRIRETVGWLAVESGNPDEWELPRGAKAVAIPLAERFDRARTS